MFELTNKEHRNVIIEDKINVLFLDDSEIDTI